ncbi:hypothetical protein [Anaeromassilibacillus sp. SJQ-5]|jgi:hypothetical protein
MPEFLGVIDKQYVRIVNPWRKALQNRKGTAIISVFVPKYRGENTMQ